MSDTRNYISTIKHSQLKKDGIDYHFSNLKDANVFIRSLQTIYWSKKVVSKLYEESHRCRYSEAYQRCSIVTIAAHQFEAIHGDKSFNAFHDFFRLLNNDKKKEDSIVFENIPASFIDEISLQVPTLSDKLCNLLAMTKVNNIDLIKSPQCRDQLIPRLFLSTIQKMFDSDKSYDFLFQMIKKSHLSIHELIIFLRKLGRQACRDLVYSQKSQIFNLHWEIQNSLFLYFNNKDFNQFILKIVTNEEVDNNIKVTILSHHERLEPRVIAKLNYQREMNKYFVDNAKKISKFTNAMFDFSHEVKPLTQKKSLLQMIDFADGGLSKDNWTMFAEEAIRYIPPVTTEKLSLNMPFRFEEEKIIELPPRNMKDFESQEWKFHRIDIIENASPILELKNPHGDYLLFRIQRKNEPIEYLIRDYQTTRYLRKEAKNLQLQSYFPEPMGLITIIGLSEWLRQKFPLSSYPSELFEYISKTEKHGVYLHKVSKENSNYFQFLHDTTLPQHEYEKANQVIIHDLIVMLKHGILFPSLADLIHHSHSISEERYDFGRFWVLAGLLLGHDNGTGRLERWLRCVSENRSNLRASGIINWQSFISMNELIGNSSHIKKYFRGVCAQKNEVINYVITNLLAEYQYVLFLLAGARGLAFEKIIKNDKDILWQNMSNQILTNCAYASSLITHRTPLLLKNIFSNLVDIERMGRQMQYWMTKEYIYDVMDDRIKEGIYSKDTKVCVQSNGIRPGTFNSINGFSFDFINSDLGNLHGQEPIKEVNKLLYFMVTYILSTYLKLQLTLNDVRKIMDSKDVVESEKLRKHSFKFLYGKEYHAIQEKLCEERLLQSKTLLPNIKQSLVAEVKNHQREKAAFTIANFWRQYKKPKSCEVEIKKVNGLIF